jgi:predicted short-subunit dehydrogenase-like oxidoreductase (DUF2520 family)
LLPLSRHRWRTCTGRPDEFDRVEGASFGVTAPDELRPVAEALVVELGGEPIWVPESARPLYHAALTMGANYLVTLVNDATDTLARAGIQSASRLIAPLLSAALDNALRLGDGAMTGPVSRGDTATVAGHLETLRRAAPEVVPTYVAMARRTAQRAEQSGRLPASRARQATCWSRNDRRSHPRRARGCPSGARRADRSGADDGCAAYRARSVARRCSS